MSNEKRPEWIETAAQAVTELYERQQECLQNTKENIERGKDQIQEGAFRAKDFLKSDLRQTQADMLNIKQTREEIAQIIHKHFQGQP